MLTLFGSTGCGEPSRLPLETVNLGLGAARRVSRALWVWFTCWISVLPAETVLVTKSLNWVTAVLHAVAHFSVSEIHLRENEPAC